MVIALAIGARISVLAVRKLGEWFTSIDFRRRHAKLRSVTSLVISALIFAIYFGAIGLIFTELGVSLTAYLASASVLGLAIGFGSQGLVQDVVTGLTLVFSDLVDVGDMVEIGGQT
jgi:small-conductance mechanosensitive channel